MGIIKQQTIKGSIYSYLGILIGFLTVSIIQPHALSTEGIGLITLLGSLSLMFAQFSILGFNGTARYFPYFRNEEKKHNGYLFLSCAISAVGSLLFIIIAYVYKDELVGRNQKSVLFEQYYWYLVPLTIFTLFFNVFDLYARMLYNMTTGLILREFTKRIFVLVTVLLVYFKLVSFNTFMVLWFFANIIPTGLIIIRLIKDKQFSLKPNLHFLDKEMVRKLVGICFFTILTGASPLIIQNIDNILITKKLGLDHTGVYSLAFNFGIIISLPSRALYSIAYTVIAESWRKNDLANIRSVYEKSCVNQLISALFLFVLIWANVDNIFAMLPPEFKAGKYAIFFVSLGFFIDSATGINLVILATSKYFKYDSLFNVLLVGVIVIANLILIPIYGITGAAIASALTFFIFNLFRYLFILIKFKMQPFKIQSLLAIISGVIVYYFSVWIIPHIDNFIMDTIVRSAFITLIYIPAVYFLKLSDDINIIIDNLIGKLKR
ncbi:lipopolysaccharide biosynthesis protein [Mucilaginibacter dorajii]|uniref:Flippase n=1 Tax=Mucilaginibacter dorajii TaxID=692994 RepID=A0ABP7R4G0_9SPHI|nr:oligosaccharide flippase family protein [Mucilaginibacter dorajii]MCS3737888.1 O-antigen/teichoic acid export membrane protein [Mucilaginibacter dorajii]